MSKDNRKFDLEECLIDFAVRIIRIAESLPKTKIEEKNHNSIFDIHILLNKLSFISLTNTPDRKLNTYE